MVYRTLVGPVVMACAYVIPARDLPQKLRLRNRLRWRANLLWIFDRFPGLRRFGEIYMETQAFLVRKTHKPQQN